MEEPVIENCPAKTKPGGGAGHPVQVAIETYVPLSVWKESLQLQDRSWYMAWPESSHGDAEHCSNLKQVNCWKKCKTSRRMFNIDQKIDTNRQKSIALWKHWKPFLSISISIPSIPYVRPV